MYILGPYLDESGIIIVKGRLDKSNLRNECKHLIMISNDSPISKLIIRWCHTNWSCMESYSTQRNPNIWIRDCVSEFGNTQIHTVLCCMQTSDRETCGTKNGRTAI